jgi:hypothetical protein
LKNSYTNKFYSINDKINRLTSFMNNMNNNINSLKFNNRNNNFNGYKKNFRNKRKPYKFSRFNRMGFPIKGFGPRMNPWVQNPFF